MEHGYALVHVPFFLLTKILSNVNPRLKPINKFHLGFPFAIFPLSISSDHSAFRVVVVVV